MKSRLHIRVFGEVQGVFFRAGTLDTVHRIRGITGWVRNSQDGSVEVMAVDRIMEEAYDDFVSMVAAAAASVPERT